MDHSLTLISQTMRTLVVCLVMLGGAPMLSAERSDQEPSLSNEQRASLSEWEGRQLKKADDIFFARDKKSSEKKRFALAATSYLGFIEEFPRSVAIVYALYQQGRSLHLDNKRGKARQCYDDILQFFPDQVPFAAAAAYFKGLSFQQDSDPEKAMKAWAVIAKDPDYRKQPIAGRAIVALADHAWKKGKYEDAAGYFWDVAKNFRHSNKDAANDAIDKVVYYYVRIDPNFPKLKEFYREVHSFGRWRKEIPDDIDEDADLWRSLRHKIRRSGRFDQLQEEQKRSFYGYWAEQMAGKRPKDDDFHKDRIDFLYEVEDDREAWFRRLDEQFAAGDQKNVDRIIQWMRWYSFDKDKVKDFYAKLDFGSMGFGKTFQVMRLLFDDVKDHRLGMLVAAKIKLDKISDRDRAELAKYMYRRDKAFAKQAVDSMDNDEEKWWTWLGLIKGDKEVPLEDKALAVSKLSTSEKYYGEAQWILGEVYEEEGEFAKAISAYYGSGKAPDMGYAAARCQMKAGNLEKAIGELSGIENMFKKEAPNAAFVQAQYYNKAGRNDQRNATLQRILKVYKGTRASSRAHEWAEKLKLPFVGGEVAE